MYYEGPHSRLTTGPRSTRVIGQSAGGDTGENRGIPRRFRGEPRMPRAKPDKQPTVRIAGLGGRGGGGRGFPGGSKEDR